jgi:hypothetical protein
MATTATASGSERVAFNDWIHNKPQSLLVDGKSIELHDFGGAMGWGYRAVRDITTTTTGVTGGSTDDHIIVLKLPHQLVLHPRNSPIYELLPPNGSFLVFIYNAVHIFMGPNNNVPCFYHNRWLGTISINCNA